MYYSRQNTGSRPAGMMPAQFGAMPAQFGAMPSQLPAPMPMTAAPAFPTGAPTGPPFGTEVGPAAEIHPPPQTLQSPAYIPGYLRTQLGRKMRVEFLIGTGAMIDRTGTLVGVGASYILLQPIDSDDIMLCDLFSIRFVTIIM